MQPAIAGYNVWTNEYTLSRQELQSVVARQFPTQLRYAEVFDVQVSHPQLQFAPEKNRLITTVQVKISSALLLQAPLNGTVTLSNRLKYDSTTRSIRLDAPNVDQVDVYGLPAQYTQQLTAIGSLIAQQVLQNYPIHTFRTEDLRIANKSFEPGAITVQSDGIAVEVNPT
ncbi:DUF1439 domain-containing protein [Glaciimonas soli]|nr:DUF1439 domain-containing protein [Glaciimonas soli]